jgi:hypothetical protein
VKHCDNFLKISDSDISQRLIDEHLHLIDGFTNLPAFIIHYLENNKIMALTSSVLSINFIDFDDMISQIKKLRNYNHIIFYEVRPFFMRISKVPLSYDIIGCQSRIRRRNEKLNQLLNE